jgi:acyl-CoA reductase-like NAD-dependent aldehyde dehydrogenase
MTPWNFPHLCTVNSVLPAIISGNAVILKPAPQTPAPGERVLSAFLAAGLPQNVLQVIHLSQETSLGKFVTDPRIDYIAFTGSVVGGRAVQEAAAKGKGFKLVGLELGGKDPAYVREDADIKWTAEQLVDGAMFNSGQSCMSTNPRVLEIMLNLGCGIERIYVHSSKFDDFVKEFAELAKQYKLGDPRKPETSLGPVVSVASAARIRKQVKDAGKLTKPYHRGTS